MRKYSLIALLLVFLTGNAIFAQNYEEFRNSFKGTAERIKADDPRLQLFKGSYLVSTEISIKDNDTRWISGSMILKPFFPSSNTSQLSLKFRNGWSSMQINFSGNSNLIADWNYRVAYLDSFKNSQEQRFSDTLAAIKHRLFMTSKKEEVQGEIKIIKLEYVAGHNITDKVVSTSNIIIPFGSLTLFYCMRDIKGGEDQFQVSLRINESLLPKEAIDALADNFPETDQQENAQRVVFETKGFEEYPSSDFLKGTLRDKERYASIFKKINFDNFEPTFFIHLPQQQTMVCVKANNVLSNAEWVEGFEAYKKEIALSYNILYPMSMPWSYAKITGTAKMYNTETGDLKKTIDFLDKDHFSVRSNGAGIVLDIINKDVLHTKILN